jgi:hypothetical protein
VRLPGPIAAIAALLFLAGPALAQEEAGHEERLEAWALAHLVRERDPEPAGKVIDEVLVASQDIIGPGDPWPDFLNAFHVTTKEKVVRRELLFEPGQPFDPELVGESERNLRSMGLFSAVRVIPLRSTNPGAVALLVATKDLWSIRLNASYALVGRLLQELRISPTELNIFGLGKQAALDFLLRLDTFSIGQVYADRRLFGSDLAFSESAAVILNRDSGEAEGSRGGIALERPLYNLATNWGFLLGGSWHVQRWRVHRGAEIWELPYPDSAGTETVPFVYDLRTMGVGGSYTRSFGRRIKFDVSGLVGGYARRYTPPSRTGLTEAQKDWLTRNYLARSEDATYLGAAFRTFEARYHVFRDLDTFDISEDYQLGHRTLLIARWAHPAWLSPTRFLEVGATQRYRLLLFGDDLVAATVAASSRYAPSGGGNPGGWVNQRLAAEVVNVTPRWRLGRLVSRGLVDLIRNDLNNRLNLLGGGNGLRGLAPEAMSGPHLLLVNNEWRTPAWRVKTARIGLVLFWDAGAAFDRRPEPIHTVGMGLRVLFPQFNVSTIRVDVGYALNGPVQPFVDRFSTTFGQITDLRPTFLDSPLD